MFLKHLYFWTVLLLAKDFLSALIVYSFNIWKLNRNFHWSVNFSVVDVQLLIHIWPFVTPWTAACQAFLSLTISWSLPKFMSMNWWWYTTILSSATIFFFSLQSLPASRSFPLSQLFSTGGQSIGVSASASVLPMNIQDWFPLGLTGLISLQSMGLSRVFSSTKVRNHQFFSAQPSLCFNSHIHTWLMEKP